jgi:aminopeptidase C
MHDSSALHGIQLFTHAGERAAAVRYTDKNSKYHCVTALTPQSFYTDICKV